MGQQFGGCEVQPVRETEIQREIDYLHEAIDSLGCAVSNLADRLTPISRDVEVSNTGELSKPEQTATTRIGTKVHTARMEIQGINRIIQSLQDRLEV